MYDNIASLKFQDGDSGEMMATGMISAEGEVMAFRQAIAAEGRVEDWMTAVLQEMRRTNRLITKEAIFRYCENKSRYFILHSHIHQYLSTWMNLPVMLCLESIYEYHKRYDFFF